MRTIDGLRRSGIGIGPERTIHEAAAIMGQAGVGALAVLDDEQLVGIVTDRDRGRPPHARVDGVMTAPVVTIDTDADLHDAFGRSAPTLFGGWPSSGPGSSSG